MRKKRISVKTLAMTLSLGSLTLLSGCKNQTGYNSAPENRESNKNCGKSNAEAICGADQKTCGVEAKSCGADGKSCGYTKSCGGMGLTAAPQDLDVEAGESQQFNTEKYGDYDENPFFTVMDEPLSTFSIDVDTASYSNMRRFLTKNELPPKNSIRIEECVNYFSYDYADPTDEHPFNVVTEIGECPWNEKHWLLHIGVQGEKMRHEEIPPCNLVFLLDVSGSMGDENKLPLLKMALTLLCKKLRVEDRISIVVYAGAAGLVLPPTAGNEETVILEALRNLEAGGSTNGGEGIELAYKVALENFVPNGVNRIILATDGDFNVGRTDQGDLIGFIEKKREEGIFLTVLGFGMWNLKDEMMEQLADHGNGNYGYIDTILEAQKMLVEELHSTLVAIAKDVKIQVEFNPAHVSSYRLIGYENRVLQTQDFTDDTKDAGEINSGHSVTALYELIPVGKETETETKLKYQRSELNPISQTNELATIKLRYKRPSENTSIPLERVVHKDIVTLDGVSNDYRFSASIAAFAMLLKDSKHKGEATMKMVKALAQEGLGKDLYGYRKEFLKLVEVADLLQKTKK